jgi:hypothetical protein
MNERATAQDGFVVVDALVAIIVLSLAGTVLIGTAVGLLDREASALDRSVALVMSQSLMRQYELLGDELDAARTTDEHFAYRISRHPDGEATHLAIVDIEAVPFQSTAGHSRIGLSFLVPESTSE